MRNKLEKEAHAVISNYIDTMLFYLSEYRNQASYQDIANIFTQEYTKTFNQIVKEVQEDTEE